MMNASVVAKIVEMQWPGCQIKYDLFLLQLKKVILFYIIINIQ